MNKLGEQAFNDRLEDVFKEAERTLFGGGRTVDAFSGVENVYNHGNQPSLHIAWLFNYGGRPWRTQHWVRRICDVFYGTDILHGYGYGQDEDQGQLGAWFVLAALGLFDVQGLTAERASLQLATPLFDSVMIHLHPEYHRGRSFEIRSTGDPSTHSYIRSARFNGEPLNQCWVYWDQVTAGGSLELVLGVNPNPDWGSNSPPPSASASDGH
jgi:putative alpha-1,2-mannosidase